MIYCRLSYFYFRLLCNSHIFTTIFFAYKENFVAAKKETCNDCEKNVFVYYFVWFILYFVFIDYITPSLLSHISSLTAFYFLSSPFSSNFAKFQPHVKKIYERIMLSRSWARKRRQFAFAKKRSAYSTWLLQPISRKF